MHIKSPLVTAEMPALATRSSHHSRFIRSDSGLLESFQNDGRQGGTADGSFYSPIEIGKDLLNSHSLKSSCRTSNVISSGAPDPRLALGLAFEPSDELPDVPVGETAAVFCALLIRHRGSWWSDPVFEQFYVSDVWVQHLLTVLRSTNLPAYAKQIGEDWYIDGKRVTNDPPDEVAFALRVERAGRSDAHLICEPGRKPEDWGALLDSATLNEDQWRHFGTLNFLESLNAGPERAAKGEQPLTRQGRCAA
jgi:hypothetical protein